MKSCKMIAATLCVAALPVFAAGNGNGNGNNANGCASLPTQATLKAALQVAIADNGGLNLHMWATIVDRDGIVCAVAFTGGDRGAQWPGSRVISAQKANTANSFSLDNLVLSTANLYTAVQPGGSLFGLQESNPVNTEVAYAGPSANYGQPNDPMVGNKIGGVNVFGGGLALYDANHKVVGAVEQSGDTSCEDHRVAWITRDELNLDNLSTVPGVSGDPARPDNMTYVGGFAHPDCGGPPPANLPAVH